MNQTKVPSAAAMLDFWFSVSLIIFKKTALEKNYKLQCKILL